MLVDTRVGKLFVEVVGEGPEVLLWHSFLCDGGMWRAQIEALRDRYRFVNIDGPGHGRSAPTRAPYTLDDCALAVGEVLGAVKIPRAAFVGLSWGGMVGMRVAARQPESVSRLVLMDTSARAEPLRKKIPYEGLLFAAKIAGPARPLFRAIEPILFGPRARRERPDLVTAVREGFVRMDRESLLRAARAVVFDRDDVSAELRAIRAPTLVVVGADDVAQPPRESRHLARQIPGATLEVVPEAGHLSALEQPETVNRLLDSFLSD